MALTPEQESNLAAIADTLTGDAKLVGVAIQYKIDVDASTAW